MEAVFLKVLNLSLNASYIIVTVLVLRLLFKNAPKWVHCLLWGIVAFRLVCPFSLTSMVSLLPSAEVIPSNIANDVKPQINSGFQIVDGAVNPVIETTFASKVEASVNPMQVVIHIAGIIWIVGVILLIVYAFISYVRLRRRVSASVKVKNNIYECDDVESPFILGILKPAIYVPSGMDAATFELVIAHENAHLSRHDHWWKPLGYILLAVYWFNPLNYLAYILLCKDIEAACDESVIKDKDDEYIAGYSQALLDCSTKRKMISACPVAFGEIGVKGRIKGIVNYKKPTLWIVIFALVACIGVSVCFITTPSAVSTDELISFIKSEKENGLHLCDIEVIGINRLGNRYKVYSWVLDEDYSYKNGELSDESSGYFPTIFTVEKNDDDFKLIEEWYPRSGSYYEGDVKDKFPVYLWKKAIDLDEYDKQHARNLANAEKFVKENDISDKIEIARPKVNLSENVGADPTYLLYVDKDRIVFSEYFGLFVYSKSKRAIVNSIDLKAIGCDKTQGDDYCEKKVSVDGNLVYLHPLSASDMYVYNISKDTLKKVPYNFDGIVFHKNPLELAAEEDPAFEYKKDPDITAGSVEAWDDDKNKVFTWLHYGSRIGELSFCETRNDDVTTYYPLYVPEGLEGAVDFKPEDIHDIVSADIWVSDTMELPPELDIKENESGMLHCEDKNVLAKLESLLSSAHTIKGASECPFYTTLYLKRADGTLGIISPATDSCGIFNSGNVCYEFNESGNEEVWNLINQFSRQ